MRRYFLIILLITAQLSYAQNNKQNIRGVVIDKLSQTTLPGACIQIVSKTENKGTSTDEKGKYVLANVNRFAGGRSDPARLAANFAGVSATDDSRNDIVIRGNSPAGVLWRIDGMDATNPNHFASIGTTGGAVSALNTNMLKSSDFFTSAWPAEYGNAISGVFDIGFRNGNTQKRETTVQLGVTTGLEAMTEGPISKSNGSSYLIGYRYALAGIAQVSTTYQLGFFPNFIYKIQF